MAINPGLGKASFANRCCHPQERDGYRDQRRRDKLCSADAGVIVKAERDSGKRRLMSSGEAGRAERNESGEKREMLSLRSHSL